MEGNTDWEKEMAAEAARNERRVQATAEDILERMRGLEMGLNLMGRYDDMEALEEAVAIMKRIVEGAN